VANALSFLILMIFLWGRTLYRKNLRLHIFIMLSVILADLLLVIGLVEKRDALGKISTDMPWTLQLHIPIAVFTLFFYFVTAWTGFQLYRGYLVRDRLRLFDKILVTARVLTLITSLMVQFVKV
jgi:hypothetical protein